MEDRGQARVVYVAQQGPAERAGLAVGDVLLSLNNQPVNLADKRCGACIAVCWHALHVARTSG